MPTIKRWSPQVEQAPLPNVQIQPMNWAGSAAVSRSLGTVADIVSRQENKAYEDEARAILAGGTAALGSARLELEGEVEKQKGDGALKQDLLGDYSVKFDEKAAAIRESLPPSLHAHFDADLAGQKLGLERSVRGHIAKEADAYSEVQHKAELSNATNIAVKSALATVQEGRAVTSNPELIEQRRRVEKESDRIVARNGWTGEAADAAKRLQMSQYHLAILEGLVTSEVDGRGAAAKAYLAKYSNEIDAQVLQKTKINAAVEGATIADESRTIADRIWAEAGGDPAKAGELARAIQSTPMMDAVEKRISARVSQDHTNTMAADKPRIGRLEQGWPAGRGLDLNHPDYTLLSDESKGTVKLKYEAYVRGKKAQNTAEKREQEALNTLLKAKYVALPVEEQVKVDFSTDRRFASADELGGYELDALKKHANTTYNKDRGVSQEQFTKLTADMVDRLAKAKAGGTWDKGRKAGFTLAMNAAYVGWSQKPGNAGLKPPEAEVMKWYDNALEYGEQSSSDVVYFQSNKFAFEARRDNETLSTKGFENDQPGRAVVNSTRRELTGAASAPPEGNADKPIVQNADGSFSTERTITIESDGRHYLIPTIVDGKARPPDEAVELWKKGTNKAVGDFATAAEAETAAKARSAAIGKARSSEAEALKLGVPADEFKRIQGLWAVDPRNTKKTILTPAQVLGAYRIDQAGKKGAK